MIAIFLVIIFLFTAWIGLVISGYLDIEGMCGVLVGLSAVCITGFSMIIKRLDTLIENQKESDNNEQQGDKTKKRRMIYSNIINVADTFVLYDMKVSAFFLRRQVAFHFLYLSRVPKR